MITEEKQIQIRNKIMELYNELFKNLQIIGKEYCDELELNTYMSNEIQKNESVFLRLMFEDRTPLVLINIGTYYLKLNEDNINKNLLENWKKDQVDKWK
jgi:hypothetical protein